MSQVIARTCFISAIALTAVAAAGCGSNSVTGQATTASSTSSGTPAPGTSTSISTSKVANVADLRPCELLNAADRTSLGVTRPPEPSTVSPATTCAYVVGTDVISIKIRSDLGLAAVRDAGGQIHELTVNGRAAKKVTGQPLGGCLVAVGIAATSRVDIQVKGDDDAKDCVTAENAAKLVEPKLPKG